MEEGKHFSFAFFHFRFTIFFMSSVYNPESDTIAEIERLELEARQIRRLIEHAKSDQDRRVLEKQLKELADQVEYLKTKLP